MHRIARPPAPPVPYVHHHLSSLGLLHPCRRFPPLSTSPSTPLGLQADLEEHEIVESLPLPARDRILAAQGLEIQPAPPQTKPKSKPKPKPKASKPKARPNAKPGSGKPRGRAPKGKVWSYAEGRWVAAPADAPPTHDANDALVGREVEKEFDGTMYKGAVQWANSVVPAPAPAPGSAPGSAPDALAAPAPGSSTASGSAPESGSSTEDGPTDAEPHATDSGPAEGGAAAKAPVAADEATDRAAADAGGAAPTDPVPTDPTPTDASAEEAVTYYRVMYEDGR